MLHAAVARSTQPHALIRRIDTSAAFAVPGVVAVVTAAVSPRIPGIRPVYGPQIEDQPILAIDRVRYVGDMVALVAAETPRAAEAAGRIVVDYEPLPAVFDPVEAMQPGAPLVHELRPDEPLRGHAVYFGLRPSSVPTAAITSSSTPVISSRALPKPISSSRRRSASQLPSMWRWSRMPRSRTGRTGAWW